MNRDDVIKRIRKLFALAEGKANRNESIAAALKAQELIAEYNVEDFEIADEAEPIIEAVSDIGVSKEWRKRLAKVVAENFRCKNFFYGKYASQKRIVFLGYSMDANAAKITYEHLFKIGDRLARKAARDSFKEYGTSYGVYNTFALGFVGGVASELEKQSQALMIVCPPKVKEAYEEMTFIGGVEKDRLKLNGTVSPDQWGRGYSAGKDAVRASRLGEGDAYLLESSGD